MRQFYFDYRHHYGSDRMARLLRLLPNPVGYAGLMNGSGGGCAPSPGNSGGVDLLALQSCNAAALAGTWRQHGPWRLANSRALTIAMPARILPITRPRLVVRPETA